MGGQGEHDEEEERDEDKRTLVLPKTNGKEKETSRSLQRSQGKGILKVASWRLT